MKPHMIVAEAAFGRRSAQTLAHQSSRGRPSSVSPLQAQNNHSRVCLATAAAIRATTHNGGDARVANDHGRSLTAIDVSARGDSERRLFDSGDTKKCRG